MNGSEQILFLLKQNMQHTKTFRLGKNKKQQAATKENPED